MHFRERGYVKFTIADVALFQCRFRAILDDYYFTLFKRYRKIKTTFLTCTHS
jgi:hypothetical protein